MSFPGRRKGIYGGPEEDSTEVSGVGVYQAREEMQGLDDSTTSYTADFGIYPNSNGGGLTLE